MDLNLSEAELAVLQHLADRGGSLPGAILAQQCFTGAPACARAMLRLSRMGLIEKGRHTCHWPGLGSALYYTLSRDALGLVTGQVWPEWLAEPGMLRFNLAAQELRYLLELTGWQWIASQREVLLALKHRGVLWARIGGHWPLLAFVRDEKLKLTWLFWQGLPPGELPAWEQVTRELRQHNLLTGVTLREAVASDLRRRLLRHGLSCPLVSLERFPLHPDNQNRIAC